MTMLFFHKLSVPQWCLRASVPGPRRMLFSNVTPLVLVSLYREPAPTLYAVPPSIQLL